MMEYIAQFAAFLVAVAGVAGNTWNRKPSGAIQLTRIGWSIAGLALVILAASWRISFVNDTEKRIAAEQRAAVQSIAEMEVCLAALRLKAVLDVQHAVAAGTLTEVGSDIGFSFDTLLAEKNIQQLQALNLMQPVPARPSVGDQRSLAAFTAEETQEFVTLINLALAKYSTFLNKALILDATRLASLNLTRRFIATQEQVEQLRHRGQMVYPGLWPAEVDEYPELVQLLSALLRKTRMLSDALACQRPKIY